MGGAEEGLFSRAVTALCPFRLLPWSSLGPEQRPCGAGRVLREPEEAHAGIDMPSAPPEGLGYGVGASYPQHAYRQIAQGRHDARTITLPDLAPILVEDHVSNPVQAVLDSPVTPHQVEKPLRCFLARSSVAGQTVHCLSPGRAAVQGRHVPFYAKDCPRVGEVEVVPQLITEPDPPAFDPTVPLVECLRLRGKKIPDAAAGYRP